MVGLFAGTQLLGADDPVVRLTWVCSATAFGAGFGIVFLVLGLHFMFGFRPVALFADALVGGFMGFLCGATLTMLLMWSRIVHHNHSLWALLLIPLGAVAVPLYRFWRGKPRVR
jgi:hypothetical protein